MTAKEMFEKLGYEEREETTSMNCIKSYINKSIMHIIYFDDDKTIDIECRIMDMDLLKAINKQVEELRWTNPDRFKPLNEKK